MKCYIENGVLVHVGEWDYSNGSIPDSWDLADIELSVTKKGRIVFSSDYRELRKDEYPDIGDQLDALWSGGEKIENMRDIIFGVKNKFPKQGI